MTVDSMVAMLRSERIARKLRDALPAARAHCAQASRSSCRRCSRPRVALNRDAFVIQDERETTVDLAGRHSASSLDELDLDELKSAAV
ncbi:MAG: hypothetical protein ACXVH1_34175 [Solirubrobacteraceae bacterium]